MQHSNRWFPVVLGGLVAVCLGCGGKTDEANGKPGNGKAAATNGGVDQPGVQPPAKPEPPPKPTVPDVQLDTALAKTCVVKAGEAMPLAELPDLAGNAQPIGDLFGKQATVVLFWNKSSMQALQELEDLGRDVVDRFADQGVAVVTVNVGDTADQISQLLETVKAKVPVLSDGDGTFFAKVATERFPRTYVLGGDGTIRWFDTEYSESTRRNMAETIKAILLEGSAP